MLDRFGPGLANPQLTKQPSFAVLVTASLAITAVTNLAPLLASGLAVQIGDDLGFGEAGLGLTVSVFFCVGALSSAISGRMVERVGPAGALRYASMVAGVTLLAIGFGARSWLALTLIVAVGGVANAWAQPAANLYISRGIPAQRQGLALGIQKSGIPAASLLGGLAVPTVGLTIGWAWAFVAGGALALAASAAVPDINRESPASTAPSAAPEVNRRPPTTDIYRGPSVPEVNRRPPATDVNRESPASTAPSAIPDINRRPPATDTDGGPSDSTAPTVSPSSVKSKPDVPIRLLALLAVSTGLGAIGSVSLGSFFVLSSVNSHVDEAAAGFLLVLGSLVGIVVRLVLGARADRSSVSAWRMLIVMFSVASLSFLGLATGSLAGLFVAMPLAFGTSFAWPGLYHLAVVRSNPSAPGAATGITMTGSFTGAVVGPLMFGFLVERAGYGWAWCMAAGTIAMAALVMALVARRIGGGTRPVI